MAGNKQEISRGWDSITQLLNDASHPRGRRKIGIEIERVGILPGGAPFSYRGTDPRAPNLNALLSALEKGALSSRRNDSGDLLELTFHEGILSLEPGSQLEFSIFPSTSLVELKNRAGRFDQMVRKVSDSWKVAWLDLGLNPYHSVAEIPLIPYRRYEIMNEYLGKRDTLGRSMMRLTASIQINLDYRNEQEAIEMLRVALAAAPLSYALFSNSPVYERKKTDLLSFRAEIWRHTDPDRSGLLPKAFDPDFNFDAYAKHLWHMPLMYMQDSAGDMIPANGKSLSQMPTPSAPNIRSSIQQIFTEARLKPGYIEIRSVDMLPEPERSASIAFWTGLLFSKDARALAQKLLCGITPEEREDFWLKTTQHGLKTTLGKTPLATIAQDLLNASKQTLVERNLGEAEMLDPLFENLKATKTPAEKWLVQFTRAVDLHKEARPEC